MACLGMAIRGYGRQGAASQSKDWLGKRRRGLARQEVAVMARRGHAMQGKAWLGKAKEGKAWLGKATRR
jgi:hypothetical protein